MNAAEKSVGQRFDEERQRLGLGVQETADACGVTRHAIGNVFRGAMPSGGLLQKFASAGADVQYVLTGRRAGLIDLNLLGLSEAALRFAYESMRDRPAVGAVRSRMSALVYNQVLAAMPAANELTAAVRAGAASVLMTLDDPGAPDLLEKNLFVQGQTTGEPAQTGSIRVSGKGHRVAGRDMISGKEKK